MTGIDEHELRRRFGQLREVDRELAPEFALTDRRSSAGLRRRPTPHLRPLVIGAAAAVAIVAASLTYARSLSRSPDTHSIVTWRAPTDVFLRTPGSEVLAAMPALGASVVDAIIPIPSNRGT
ncbi:MAG: hypothetical protein M3P12_11125 [Gemmatimonadota bacterium]|nr:hypothetical protein [Gemmatimonadota bacterium]